MNAGNNSRALGLYELMKELKEEAIYVNVQCKLVSDGKLQRMWMAKYQNVDAKLVSYWTEFAAGTGTCSDY